MKKSKSPVQRTVDRNLKLNIAEPKVYAVRDYVMSVKQVYSKIN